MPSLRFVEINGKRQNVEILENLPSQIVGHKGEIKPQITNGHISRHHATVCYNHDDESWLVTDGDSVSGVKSKNGLKTWTGETINGEITLKDVGDRVYLLYLYDTNAYLEVFATNQEQRESTSGLEDNGVKPEIDKLVVNTSLIKGQVVKVSETVSSAANNLAKVSDVQTKLSQQVKDTNIMAVANLEHLEQVDIKQDELVKRIDSVMDILDRGLNQVEDIGSKPKQFLLGFSIFCLGGLSLIFMYGFYRNVDMIMKTVFDIEQIQLEKK